MVLWTIFTLSIPNTSGFRAFELEHYCIFSKHVGLVCWALAAKKIMSEICQRRQLAPRLTPTVSSVSVHRAGTRAIGSVTVWRTHLSKYVYQGRETWREATVQQCWRRSGPSGWRPQANCWSTICDTLHRTLHSLFTKCISTFCLGSLCKNINIIT